MSFIGTFADNACSCLQQDINKALGDLSSKVNTAASKLSNMITGPLNNPITQINQTVLDAQHAAATAFEGTVKDTIQGVISGATSALGTSCFTQPFADFLDGLEAEANGFISGLAGLITGMDFTIPTINLNFQIALSVNMCGGSDLFSGPLASILAAGGLSAKGAFDISGAFAGMIFPPGGDYEAKFKEMIGSVTNIMNMQNVIDNVVSAVNDRIDAITGKIDAGIDAVKNFADNASKQVNSIVATISDPSRAVSELVNRIPIPGAVMWAAKFAGMFGFGPPGIGGGGKPLKPRDVNYLTKKGVGGEVNSLLNRHELSKTDPEFFNTIADRLELAGFHREKELATEEGLGKALKQATGETDSPLSDAEFAQMVKQQAAQQSMEGSALATPAEIAAVEAQQEQLTQLQNSVAAAQDELKQLQEQNIPGVAEANKHLEEINTSLSDNINTLHDLRELRTDPSLTTADKAALDSTIVDLEQNRRDFQDSHSRITDIRDGLIRDATPLPGGGGSLPASELAGARPPEEPRFSTLVPIPGSEPRFETVTPNPANASTTNFGDSTIPSYGERLNEATKKASDIQDAQQRAQFAIEDAQELRATKGLSTAEKANLDAIIAQGRVTQDQLSTAFRAAEENRLAVLSEPPAPFQSRDNLSTSVASPLPRQGSTDPLAGFDTRAYNAEVDKVAKTIRGPFQNLTDTQIENLSPDRRASIRSLQANEQVATLPASTWTRSTPRTATEEALQRGLITQEDVSFSNLLNKGGVGTAALEDQARELLRGAPRNTVTSEVIVDRRSSLSTQSSTFSSSPGGTAALQARANVPNNEELLAQRIAEAHETRISTPPPWLDNFLLNFNGQ